MENLYVAIFVILIGANFEIGRAFYADEDISVDKAVDFYNSIPGLSWRAAKYGSELSQIESKLGSILKPKETKYGFSLFPPVKQEVDDLPKNYDCRAEYPHCTTISSIKDQANCGSSWAISVATAASDRFCIHSKGKINANMSADQLLACDEKSQGCNGGNHDTAWRYIAEKGIVTGGDYGSNEGCRPYSISPNYQLPVTAETPKCGNTTCSDSYKVNKDTIAKIDSTEYKIRKEIKENGPLTTSFTVYESFKHYKSGVYYRLPIELQLGTLAVRVIGWGEENGFKYWIAANAWGKNWGENGTFRIRRGTNECDFEAHMVAALPIF